MVTFDPKNPFPLLVEGSATYAEEQLHSEAVDLWLGFETEKIEALVKSRFLEKKSVGELTQDQNFWIDLPVKTLMTPYLELRRILNELKISTGQTLVDLGAGYGRLGFVCGHLYPSLQFIGYEVVTERVNEAQRCLRAHGMLQFEMKQQDLADPNFTPIEANYYFIYDYGSRRAIQKTLLDLKEISKKSRFQVIGRGRAVRDAIEREHAWLSQVHPPVHKAHYSIYQS